MWLVLFMPWAMIGAFGCTARNSFHTDACVPENSAFNTILSGTSNSLNSRPTRVTPQSIAYWRKASFTRSGLRGARSGRNTGPWPKPNSSTKRAKLTATFLPTGQAAEIHRVAREASDPVDCTPRQGRGGKVNGEQQCHSGDEEGGLPGLPCHGLGAQIYGRSARLLPAGPGVISAGHWCEPNGTCGGRVTAMLRLASWSMMA